MRILSLGAGVQSSTLLLMSCLGELPRLDAAIFADTQWESVSTYEYLAWLRVKAGASNIPIYQVSKGNLRADAIKFRMNRRSLDGKRFASMPVFIKNNDGSQGMTRRQCTREYKIEPLLKEQRTLVGLQPRARAKGVIIELWKGISLDEIYRAKPGQEKWIDTRFPLLDLRMTRRDCLAWNERHGFPVPPRSSCIGCPYHNDYEWRDMRDNRPLEWADAVAFDHAIREADAAGQSKRKMLVGLPYLHRSMVPLDEVDLSTAEERGQPNLFNNECEGLCGV